MCTIGRKREENRRKRRQFGTNFPFFPVPFSPLFHSPATFASSSFDEFCQPDLPTGKMAISGLADISRLFGQRRRLSRGFVTESGPMSLRCSGPSKGPCQMVEYQVVLTKTPAVQLILLRSP